MARKPKNTVTYFPHYADHGKKMHLIRNKFGNDGYAVWFMLLEELGKAEYHFLDFDDDTQIMYLADQFKVDEPILISIIELLIKLKEFDANLWQDNILWSQKFVDSIEDAYRKRKNEAPSLTLLIQHLSDNGRSLNSFSRSKGAINTQSILDNTITDNNRAEQNRKKQKKEKDFLSFECTNLDDFLSEIPENEKIAGFCLQYLNELAGTSYPENSIPFRSHILTLLQNQYTENQIREVIEFKVDQSNKNIIKREWLAPQTIFNLEKFAKYVESVKDFKSGRNQTIGNKSQELDRRRKDVERLKELGIH